MKPKQGVTTQRTLVAVALSLRFGRGQPGLIRSAPCASNVSRQGKVITVKPTGRRRHEEPAVRARPCGRGGPGTVVQLTRGKFYTAQLVATNLKGTIRGEGMKHTIIQNFAEAIRYSRQFNSGSVLRALTIRGRHCCRLVNGDFTVRNLAIEIVGVEPTNGWTLSDVGLTDPLKALADAITIVGERADVRVSGCFSFGPAFARLTRSMDSIFTTAFISKDLAAPPTPPLAGSYEVRDSRFRNIATATDVANLKDAEVVFENNVYDYEGAYSTVEIADVTNTNVRIVGNYISSSVSQIGVSGINITTYGFQPNGFTDSRLFIAHNTIKGTGTAISIDGALKFSGKTSCHACPQRHHARQEAPRHSPGSGNEGLSRRHPRGGNRSRFGQEQPHHHRAAAMI